MEHIFKKKGVRVLVLLHGTSGNEHDLVNIAEIMDPEASLLGIRGSVEKDGKNIFFNQADEKGIYNLADLQAKAKELAEFIQTAAKQYEFSLSDCVFVGYDNGANIAIQLLVNQFPIHQAILLHPNFPVELEQKPDFSQVQVYLTMGRNDPEIPLEDYRRVFSLFDNNDAEVTQMWSEDERVTYDEVTNAKIWLEEA
ncbi:MAG TPA: dienelactone hydrolase family protein [Tetragenococcus sp.]|nr:dienelactone hydrolase family protein [Tetragenococcus sp.]